MRRRLPASGAVARREEGTPHGTADHAACAPRRGRGGLAPLTVAVLSAAQLTVTAASAQPAHLDHRAPVAMAVRETARREMVSPAVARGDDTLWSGTARRGVMDDAMVALRRRAPMPHGGRFGGGEPPAMTPVLPPSAGTAVSTVVPSYAMGQPKPPAPWWAPVASLAVPGSGQFALRQQRSVAYLVAEAFLLVQYVSAQRDGDRERLAYRDLARNVARKPFGGTQPGTWDYYERLEQFLESGAYDRVPGGALDPELDPATFNGARWRLARETFWRDPEVAPALSSAEYQRALDFYRRTAVTDAFRWSWFDATLEQDLYIQTIRSANRSYQRAVNVLGAVAVNHLASLIDAYISVRIRRYGGVQVAGFTLDGVQVAFEPGRGLPTGSVLTGVRFSR